MTVAISSPPGRRSPARTTRASGKNHAREIVNELFFAAGLAQHLGGNKIASGAGLLTALHRQPALLLQIDEFGMFMSAAADRKRSPRHITEILDNMTELYTAAGGVFFGAEYANHDGRNERRDIVQPCLCVYGTTTPVHFWNALQSADVVDGSLARLIILPTEGDYPEEATGRGIPTAPPTLVERLRLVATGGGHTPVGNLSGLGEGAATAVEPMTVRMTPEASEVFGELGSDITNVLRQARGTAHTALLARVSENAQKLALMLRSGRDRDMAALAPPALREEREGAWRGPGRQDRRQHGAARPARRRWRRKRCRPHGPCPASPKTTGQTIRR